MRYTDFQYIKYFTYQELVNTGANVDGVQYDTIHNLDRFRSMLGKPIHLLKNGLNSGNHKSVQHPRGEAVDWYNPNIKDMDVPRILLMAGSCGFRGIGVYFNQDTGLYMFHFDTRKDFVTWSGWKLNWGMDWDYTTKLKIPL